VITYEWELAIARRSGNRVEVDAAALEQFQEHGAVERALECLALNVIDESAPPVPLLPMTSNHNASAPQAR
jgi:hypothetical protein